MLFASTTLLSVALLVSASPVSTPHKRGAAVIPISSHTRRSSNVFDVEKMRKQLVRHKHKYNADRWQSASVTRRGIDKPVAALPAFDIQELRKRQTGGSAALPLTDGSGDAVYFGPISIGSPAQDTTVQFDTGSADLVVPVSSCMGCQGPLFDTSSSTSFAASTIPFSIQYEDNSGATGVVAQDVVTVAGLTASSQTFAAVNQEAQGFSVGNAGIMGLGFPALADSKGIPFFVNLASAGSLASNLFSFYLARDGATGSELCFGCIDSTKFTGNIYYTPLDSSVSSGNQVFWNIASQGLSYNDAPPQVPFSAVIDSGSSGIIVPVAVAEAFYAQIPNASPASQEVSAQIGGGNGIWTIPCDEFSTLGMAGFVFNNNLFSINQEDFNLGAVQDGSTQCVAAILGSDSVGGMAVLGDAFMKSWYSVFDMGNSQIGFALANH